MTPETAATMEKLSYFLCVRGFGPSSDTSFTHKGKYFNMHVEVGGTHFNLTIGDMEYDTFNASDDLQWYYFEDIIEMHL